MRIEKQKTKKFQSIVNFCSNNRILFISLVIGSLTMSPIASWSPVGAGHVAFAAPTDFSISMLPFDLGSNAYSEVSGQPTGVGNFTNGGLQNYPEGTCIPILVEVTNKTSGSLNIDVSPVFDYFSSSSNQVGISDLEYITTPLSDPMDAANLNDFDYSGDTLTSAGTMSFPGIMITNPGHVRTPSTSVSASALGAFSGNDTTSTLTTATDAFRHYNVTLQNVPANETTEMLFCARLDVDASQYANGGPMSIRTVQGGQENVSVTASNLLELPSLTLTKVVSSGTAAPDEFSFVVSPAINNQSIFDIPDGQSSVVINNVSPDGIYSVTETGPAGYSFASGAGTNCSFSNDTASATVAAGDPATNATCTFTNVVDGSSVTVTKIVTNDNGGTAVVSDFPLFVDATPVTSGVSAPFAPGTYTISETNLTGYVGTIGGDCAADGTITLGEAQNANCTITNDDQQGSLTVVKAVDGGSLSASDFDLNVTGTSFSQSFDGSDTGTVLAVDAGTYTVSETATANYNGTFSGDCDADGNVTITSGGSATCTLTNTFVDPGPSDGTITVIKQVTNDNGGTAVVSDFPLFVNSTGVVSGETNIFTPGVYQISETNMTGYAATFSGDCDENGSIDLAAGDTLTCTITNDDVAATLTVVKQVTNDNGGTMSATDFPLFVDAQSVTTGVPSSFSAGTYTVSETNSANYTATFSGDCDANGSVDLSLGENATCTITNDDVGPTITVIKNVVNDNGGTEEVSDVTLFVDGNAVTSGDASAVSAGTHTVTESGPSGYVGTFGGDCDAQGSVTVAIGDNAVCTLTNDDQPATITVTKVVVNDDNGTSEVSDFPLFVDNTQVTSGVAANFDAGTYVIGETNSSGYTSTYSGDCDANGNLTVGVGESADCTITNNDVHVDDGGEGGGGNPAEATITVTKVVVGGTAVVSDFPLFVDQTQVTSGNALTVAPGTYTISETNQTNYVGVITGDCDANGSVTVVADDAAACTITNTFNDPGNGEDNGPPDPATLTVFTVMINDDGGTRTADHFTDFVSGTNVSQGSFSGDTSGVAVTLDAGSFDVTQDSDGSYTTSYSGDCSGTASSGDALTCTITNNDIAHHHGGGGGGGGGGSSTPSNPSTPTTPVTTPAPVDPGPTPRVLGETDVADPVDPGPTPQVLGAEDELPRTGFPADLLGLTALTAAGWAASRRKK